MSQRHSFSGRTSEREKRRIKTYGVSDFPAPTAEDLDFEDPPPYLASVIEQVFWCLSARVRQIIREKYPRRVFFCFYKGVCTWACEDNPSHAIARIRQHHMKNPHHYINPHFSNMKQWVDEMERRKRIRNELREKSFHVHKHHNFRYQDRRWAMKGVTYKYPEPEQNPADMRQSRPRKREREYSLEARSSRKKETTPVEKNRNKEKKQNLKVDVNIPSIGIEAHADALQENCVTSSSSAKVRFETSAMKLELDPIQDEKCGAMNKFMDFSLDIDDLSQYEIIDEVHQSSPSIPSIEKHDETNEEEEYQSEQMTMVVLKEEAIDFEHEGIKKEVADEPNDDDHADTCDQNVNAINVINDDVVNPLVIDDTNEIIDNYDTEESLVIDDTKESYESDEEKLQDKQEKSLVAETENCHSLIEESKEKEQLRTDPKESSEIELQSDEMSLNQNDMEVKETMNNEVPPDEEPDPNISNVNPSKQTCNIIYSTMEYSQVIDEELSVSENSTTSLNCEKDHTSIFEVNDEIENQMFKEILKNTDSTIESIRETIIKNTETSNDTVTDDSNDNEKNSKCEPASPKSQTSPKGDRIIKDNLQLRIVKKDGVFKINKKRKSKRMTRCSSRHNDEPQKLHFGVDDYNFCRTCQVPIAPTTNFSVNILSMELEFSCPNCEEKYLLSNIPKLMFLFKT